MRWKGEGSITIDNANKSTEAQTKRMSHFVKMDLPINGIMLINLNGQPKFKDINLVQVYAPSRRQFGRRSSTILLRYRKSRHPRVILLYVYERAFSDMTKITSQKRTKSSYLCHTSIPASNIIAIIRC